MIVLQGISKSYRAPEGRRRVFHNLSLVLPLGRSLGVIGRNGAGKSTLLRIIAGIEEADRGRVIARDRISWPVAFRGYLQDDLTGRQNARFVCRLYARAVAVAEKVAFIEAFSELGPDFDRPVQGYSSGMRARLAFAVSMAFDFDHYLVDEVMAVGDASFRRKCLAMLRQKCRHAGLVLASRNMRRIRRHCDQVLFLGRHEARLFERVRDGIHAYRREESAAARAGSSA